MSEPNITLEEIKEMNYQEFQRWVCKCLSATHTESSFDGRVNFPESIQFDKTLIRIEQFGPVGEPIVKMTVDRLSFAGENTVIILAKSFTELATNLASNYRREGKGNIYLVTIESIMNKTPEEIFSNLKNQEEMKQMPSREYLKKFTCPVCGKDFYVEYKNSPSHCPFCISLLSLNPAYRTTHKCAITGATFTLIEAHETGTCGALGGREQICAECENVIEK